MDEPKTSRCPNCAELTVTYPRPDESSWDTCDVCKSVLWALGDEATSTLLLECPWCFEITQLTATESEFACGECGRGIPRFAIEAELYPLWEDQDGYRTVIDGFLSEVINSPNYAVGIQLRRLFISHIQHTTDVEALRLQDLEDDVVVEMDVPAAPELSSNPPPTGTGATWHQVGDVFGAVVLRAIVALSLAFGFFVATAILGLIVALNTNAEVGVPHAVVLAALSVAFGVLFSGSAAFDALTGAIESVTELVGNVAGSTIRVLGYGLLLVGIPLLVLLLVVKLLKALWYL